jgi:hypothetical protein
MKTDSLLKTLLLVVAVLLGLIMLRPQGAETAQVPFLPRYELYIEPGTTMLRTPDGSQQVLGKVVVDLRNGKVWGFPTLGAQPYPSDPTQTTPPVSHPIYLGQYDLAATSR